MIKPGEPWIFMVDNGQQWLGMIDSGEQCLWMDVNGVPQVVKNGFSKHRGTPTNYKVESGNSDLGVTTISKTPMSLQPKWFGLPSFWETSPSFPKEVEFWTVTSGFGHYNGYCIFLVSSGGWTIELVTLGYMILMYTCITHESTVYWRILFLTLPSETYRDRHISTMLPLSEQCSTGCWPRCRLFTFNIDSRSWST